MSILQILIGAELDKIISIVMVTMVLAISAARARSLLHRSVAGQAAASQLASTLDPQTLIALLGEYQHLLCPSSGAMVAAISPSWATASW